MKRILNIILIIAGISASVMAAPLKTVAVGVATKEFHNAAVIDGLHVALPEDTRSFPAALVPLP